MAASTSGPDGTNAVSAPAESSTAPETELTSKNRNKAQKESSKYQRKFRAVEPLRSQDIPNLFCNNSENGATTTCMVADQCIFVDVRTAAERAVSVIEGSLTLQEFQADEADDCQHQQLLQDKTVIVYCTIGYRSGLEATRLHQLYPHLQLYNLDGIVAYSHALQQYGDVLPAIVDPETGGPATRIHTFAKHWDYVDHYEGVHFHAAETALRICQVGTHSVVRTTQTVLHQLKCCNREIRPRGMENG